MFITITKKWIDGEEVQEKKNWKTRDLSIFNSRNLVKQKKNKKWINNTGKEVKR